MIYYYEFLEKFRRLDTFLTLGTYLNVEFFALSIADLKKGGFHLKKQSWPSRSHEGQPQGQNEGHHWIPRWNLL